MIIAALSKSNRLKMGAREGAVKQVHRQPFQWGTKRLEQITTHIHYLNNQGNLLHGGHPF
jgi:hypothetical protein